MSFIRKGIKGEMTMDAGLLCYGKAGEWWESALYGWVGVLKGRDMGR